MKIVRALCCGKAFYAVKDGDVLHELSKAPYDGIEYSGKDHPACEVKILAPCEPTKIVAVGLNYGEHIKELQMEKKPDPTLFIKPSSSVIADGETIIRPLWMSERTDYEAELAIVIGKTASNVSVEDARNYIFGYTCLNDVTARDLQKSDGQWTRAKGFDTFCPIGPHIETELDPGDLRVQSILNGQIMQDDTTASMINDSYELLSFISKIMTLYPGDVIATGTPKGISPMNKGDEIIIRVEGIGDLKNIVD